MRLLFSAVIFLDITMNTTIRRVRRGGCYGKPVLNKGDHSKLSRYARPVAGQVTETLFNLKTKFPLLQV